MGCSKTNSPKPALTLKEIQRIEAEKLAEQKKIEAQIKSEQAAKAWATAAAAEKQAKAEKASAVLPSTWGSTTVAPVTKTLAEIQKEEAERAKAKLAAAAAAAAASTSAVGSVNAATKLGSSNASLPVQLLILFQEMMDQPGPLWLLKQPSTPVTKNRLLMSLPHQLLRLLLNCYVLFLQTSKTLLLLMHKV